VERPQQAGLLEPTGRYPVGRLQLTIDPTQRIAVHRELLQAETGDVSFMPLYWEMQASYLARGVTPSPTGVQLLTNFFAWKRD